MANRKNKKMRSEGGRWDRIHPETRNQIGGQGLAGIPQSVQDDKGNVIDAKTNLTLALGGMDKLQRRLAFGENRRKGRKNWRRDGMAVTKEGIDDTKANDSVKGMRVWLLSEVDAFGHAVKNFCADCGKTSCNNDEPVPGSDLKEMAGGISLVDVDRPDLGMRPGDGVYYFVCGRCAETALKEQEGPLSVGNDEHPLLLDSKGNEIGEEYREREVDKIMQERADRMLKHAIEWIQSAKLRGLNYIEMKGT